VVVDDPIAVRVPGRLPAEHEVGTFGFAAIRKEDRRGRGLWRPEADRSTQLCVIVPCAFRETGLCR